MKRKLMDFSKRFIEMAHDFQKELEKKNVHPKRVICLFRLLPSVYHEFLDTLSTAANITDLFNILSAYWDHFNYHLLERLIMAPGIEEYIDTEKCCQLQRTMEQYVKEMDMFRQQTTLDKILHFGKSEDVPNGFGRLKVTFNWSLTQTLLQEVENFRQYLAKEIQVLECLLFFKQVLWDPAPVTLIWWIPKEGCARLGYIIEGEEHINAEVVNWVSR